MKFQIIVKEKEVILGEKVVAATSILQRLKGLMFQKSFENFDGMIISPCNSIHTFFMKMPIHVIFLNKFNRVIKVYKNLKPWRITPIFFSAEKVLELSIKRDISVLEVGDYVEVICLN